MSRKRLAAPSFPKKITTRVTKLSFMRSARPGNFSKAPLITERGERTYSDISGKFTSVHLFSHGEKETAAFFILPFLCSIAFYNHSLQELRGGFLFT